MFGGKLESGWANVTDELWVFNVPARTWQRKNPVAGSPAQVQLYAVEGHTAHCVVLDGGEAVMLVIFGYSPLYSYISNVQEYHLSESSCFKWQPCPACSHDWGGLICTLQEPTPGWCQRPKGPFRREATATPAPTIKPAAAFTSTGAIRRCRRANLAWWTTSIAMMSTRARGGLAEPVCVVHLFTLLAQDDCGCRFILRESAIPRYLHSAVLLSGTLLIFGGNTHNDTSLSNGAKCFSADFLAYDIGEASAASEEIGG